MNLIDVFNGDADGLCALHQLRLVHPARSQLITGVKRDTRLLQKARAGPGDRVTVLDISLDQNRDALLGLLECGVEVQYFDHHYAGSIPEHPNLSAIIDPDPQVCTSMLVDRHLEGAARVWAVVAAFGDNLGEAAVQLAATLGLSTLESGQLRELGECLNYNAYGANEAELLFPPAQIYRSMQKYSDPFAYMREQPVYAALRARRGDDMKSVAQIAPRVAFPGGAVYFLPDAPSSRRISGEFANRLSSIARDTAYAILTPNGCGSYTVSVRAPLHSAAVADKLCRSFPGGGGRALAAGIGRLDEAAVVEFLTRFQALFACVEERKS
jgi:hypothetical protein